MCKHNIRSFFMPKIEKIVASLQKLYSKRDTVNKQILDAEKKLVSEAKAIKPAVSAGRPAAKKPVTRKPRVRKPAPAK